MPSISETIREAKEAALRGHEASIAAFEEVLVYVRSDKTRLDRLRALCEEHKLHDVRPGNKQQTREDMESALEERILQTKRTIDQLKRELRSAYIGLSTPYYAAAEHVDPPRLAVSRTRETTLTQTLHFVASSLPRLIEQADAGVTAYRGLKDVERLLCDLKGQVGVAGHLNEPVTADEILVYLRKVTARVSETLRKVPGTMESRDIDYQVEEHYHSLRDEH